MGKDFNQATIERVFRQEGATVVDLHTLGKGIPDLLVGVAGRNVLVEIKLPAGRFGGTSRSDLNHRQVGFHHHWRGDTPRVIRTEDEARDLVRELELEFESGGVP